MQIYLQRRIVNVAKYLHDMLTIASIRAHQDVTYSTCDNGNTTWTMSLWIAKYRRIRMDSSRTDVSQKCPARQDDVCWAFYIG